MRDHVDELKAKNVQVLGISFDTVEENAAFAEKFDFPFPLLCDTDRKVGVAYHATEEGSSSGARRISYLIDEQGKILKAYDSVKPKEHATEVLADAG